MAQTFNRVLTPEASLQPGEYTIENESRRAALCCKYCGLVFSLPVGFSPNLAGLVNYEVACPQTSCGWKSFAILDSIWEAP